MKISYADRFKRNFKNLDRITQNKFEKQIGYLLNDILHPSLNAKKYHESNNIWQARVDRNFRFYFNIDKDIYYLLDIRKHPK